MLQVKVGDQVGGAVLGWRRPTSAVGFGPEQLVAGAVKKENKRKCAFLVSNIYGDP